MKAGHPPAPPHSHRSRCPALNLVLISPQILTVLVSGEHGLCLISVVQMSWSLLRFGFLLTSAPQKTKTLYSIRILWVPAIVYCSTEGTLIPGSSSYLRKEQQQR